MLASAGGPPYYQILQYLVVHSGGPVMSQRFVALLVCAVLGILVFESRGAEPSKASLNDLSMEVDALLTIHRFQFTAAQLEAIRKWAPETMQKPSKRQEPKENDKLRQTLVDLRAELIKDDPDDDQIADLAEKLTELKDDDDVELEDDFLMTDAARKRTPELLRLLTARQVAAYANDRADEIPEPLERLTEALDEVLDLNDGEWKELCEEIVDELSWVLGGVTDKKKAKLSGDLVTTWLTQVRLAARARVLPRQRAELEKSARLLLVPPTTVLHNFTEHTLAELLSNPRLAAALDARSMAGK
jgi:hypothetical protein